MPQDRDRFAKAIATARSRTKPRLSQRTLGRLLVEYGGDEVSGQAVGEWERGNTIPGRANAVALARIFDDPELARMLGYDVNDVEATITSELDELRSRVDQYDAVIAELRQQTSTMQSEIERLRES